MKDFRKDGKLTEREKNRALADLLQVAWLDLDIVRIDRVGEGSEGGWAATFREEAGDAAQLTEAEEAAIHHRVAEMEGRGGGNPGRR